jgi:hypothetical protein
MLKVTASVSRTSPETSARLARIGLAFARGGKGGSEEDDLEAGRGGKLELVDGGFPVSAVEGLVDLVKDELGGEAVLGVSAEPGETLSHLVADGDEQKHKADGRARVIKPRKGGAGRLAGRRGLDDDEVARGDGEERRTVSESRCRVGCCCCSPQWLLRRKREAADRAKGPCGGW